MVSSVTTQPMGSFESTNTEGGIMPSPQKGYAIEKPIPYRTPEKMRIVEVAGYRNERNEVIFPSRMLVIEEEAQWNMEAVRNPHRAYIKPEHIRALPNATPTNYNNANTAEITSLPEAIPTRELATMDNIDITGLFRKDQELAAASMAGPEQVAIYDNDLGWVLIPQTQAVPEVIFQ